MFCRPSGSLMTSLEAWDKIIGISTHHVRGSFSGLVSLSRVVAYGTCVTAVRGVTMGPAVTPRAFDRCRGRDGGDVGRLLPGPVHWRQGRLEWW
jgi:hypothetical protein